MKVSKKFIGDFAYLANYYKWDSETVEEMKQAVRSGGEEMKTYITELAEAHRAGYKQTQENNYMRLIYWKGENHA